MLLFYGGLVAFDATVKLYNYLREISAIESRKLCIWGTLANQQLPVGTLTKRAVHAIKIVILTKSGVKRSPLGTGGGKPTWTTRWITPEGGGVALRCVLSAGTGRCRMLDFLSNWKVSGRVERITLRRWVRLVHTYSTPSCVIKTMLFLELETFFFFFRIWPRQKSKGRNTEKRGIELLRFSSSFLNSYDLKIFRPTLIAFTRSPRGTSKFNELCDKKSKQNWIGLKSFKWNQRESISLEVLLCSLVESEPWSQELLDCNEACKEPKRKSAELCDSADKCPGLPEVRVEAAAPKPETASKQV